MKISICHNIKTIAVAALSFLAVNALAAEYDIAAYVWPAYQPEPRWAELGIFKDGKGEWQNLYESVKRFDDDYQGVKPLWGYTDESDPVEVSRKIDAALAAGVNVFIYDWYWYDGRPFLENALNNGFLGAKNNERMRFYIMWANHDVNGLWNNKVGDKKEKDKVIWPARVSDEDFRTITARWIAQYFNRPNYYRIGGKPVFMLYDVESFIKWHGAAKARERIDYLRAEVKKAGLPGLHFQILFQPWWDEPMRAAVKALKPDSMTVYNWLFGTWLRMIDKSAPALTYREWGEMAIRDFAGAKKIADDFGVPFFPNITVGWDTNARYPRDAKEPIAHGTTPEKFERFSRQVKAWAEANLPDSAPRLITVNSWNEWTEGSYLEPDNRFGYGYLNALWRVFIRDL